MDGARKPWHPPLVPLRRHSFINMHALFAAVETHARHGNVVRLYQYDAGRRGPVDIVLNGDLYLVTDRHPGGRVVGSFGTVGQAVLASDQHVEGGPSYGGAA